MSVTLKVEVGAGMVSDALEECWELGRKLGIGIWFESIDCKWQVFPHWDSATQFTKDGAMIQWRRRGSRHWIRREDSRWA